MLKIAICDDEKAFHKNLGNVISRYLEEKKTDYHIDSFDSGEKLLALDGNLLKYSIIFLDINMNDNDLDGIKTAMRIRSLSEEIFIVFVTAYVDYSLEGYKVNAIRYLLKSNKHFDSSVRECMDAITHAREHENIVLQLNFREGRRAVNINRIIYIESRLHDVNFHIIEEDEQIYTLTSTLNDVEALLNDHLFLRIHQSYLVNIRHIKNIKSYRAILDNGEELSIPRPKFHMVKELFAEYKGEL